MRKRNKDESIQRLIRAVGEILKEKGYTGLGINKIAVQAGLSKELIYRYFHSLNNLLRAYIEGKDYWQPLLNDLNERRYDTDEEVLRLFTEMLQNQFRFFAEEPEMQKFILWQISEPNTLMRSISEERELAGAKLLALTDGHFRGSGINFRAIIALLLGGIYYIVLHAEHNKSTVAGVDVNREQDREAVIRQIIGWAWKAADEAKNNKND
jgi:AcrR family transcriptional regulator